MFENFTENSITYSISNDNIVPKYWAKVSKLWAKVSKLWAKKKNIQSDRSFSKVNLSVNQRLAAPTLDHKKWAKIANRGG